MSISTDFHLRNISQHVRLFSVTPSYHLGKHDTIINTGIVGDLLKSSSHIDLDSTPQKCKVLEILINNCMSGACI